MQTFDITFIGHMCYDEIVPFQGKKSIAPGSAVMCGAMAAANVGKKVAVVTKMHPDDSHILKPMTDAGITVFMLPAQHTTYMRVVHPSCDVDEREMTQVRNAGFFTISDMPDLKSAFIHLAGITDREFTREFIDDLSRTDNRLSIDLQSFVRQVDVDTGKISLNDVPAKKDLVRHFTKIKLDMVEAEILTGASTIEEAARIFEGWGAKETVITQTEGVLGRVNGITYYSEFNNQSTVGRTGRGDTTFAGYLAWRMNHDADESLKFASALASLKMEKPGPFTGTLDEVLIRKNTVR